MQDLDKSLSFAEKASIMEMKISVEEQSVLDVSYTRAMGTQ